MMKVIGLFTLFNGVTAQSTSMCAGSPPQMCRMMCPPVNCPAGQCAMRTRTCCDTQCQAPASNQAGLSVTPPQPAVATQMCAGSPPQMCRMMCPPVNCPAGQCAMRTGTCCDTQCQSPGH
jgi:hypothetical protein